MELNDHIHCRPFVEAGPLSQLEVWYEEGRNVLWAMLHAAPRPAFTPALLADIRTLKAAVKEFDQKIDFIVTGSSVPGIFNVGGDLAYFARNIREGNRGALQDYAHECVETMDHLMSGFGIDAISIAMVEGSAMGGGFEVALAHDFLFVQDDARMGFPEIAFNLFPGMGAYSLASRRAGRNVAEDLIMSGDVREGAWHHAHGLADRMFTAGEGYRAVRTFIDELRPKLNGVHAMLRTRKRVLGVPKQELMDITDDWARSAFDIEEKDLAYMERLVMLQNRRMGKSLRVAA